MKLKVKAFKSELLKYIPRCEVGVLNEQKTVLYLHH